MLATQGCHRRFLAGRGTQNVDTWLTHARRRLPGGQPGCPLHGAFAFLPGLGVLSPSPSFSTEGSSPLPHPLLSLTCAWARKGGALRREAGVLGRGYFYRQAIFTGRLCRALGMRGLGDWSFQGQKAERPFSLSFQQPGGHGNCFAVNSYTMNFTINVSNNPVAFCTFECEAVIASP